MTKFALPTDLPSTERLFKAAYYTLADHLAYYLGRGTPLTKGEREQLEKWFRSGPESPDPIVTYERWELESVFYEIVEALTGAAVASPSSRPELVGLSGGALETKAWRSKVKGRSSRRRAQARVSASESPGWEITRPASAQAPDAA